MAIRLCEGPPPFVPVKLGRDAFIRLRPAQASEVDAALADVAEKIAGLLLGGEIAQKLAPLLPGFDLGSLAEQWALAKEETAAVRMQLGLRTHVERVSDRLVLIELIARLNDGWSGFEDVNGKKFDDKPDAAVIALLIEDLGMREKCRQVIYAQVYEETNEGNGLAALPVGGAPAGGEPVPNADPLAPLAQPAVAAAEPANAALK